MGGVERTGRGTGARGGSRGSLPGRSGLLAAERQRIRIPVHGSPRVGIGYPNGYEVAHSSLAFQWVAELAGRVPGVGVERFVAVGPAAGRTLETGTPLGNLDVLAWSCSFELDAPHILRALEAAGIAPRWRDRTGRDPLVVLGGAVATIDPLPLAPAVDVFCLGAAEILLAPLLELHREAADREELLDRLAELDGYLVPSRHLDDAGRPRRRLRKLEKNRSLMEDPALVPASWVITPHTEYSGRGLVEMSRGCPEKCRYCWISHNTGRLLVYPTEAILARVEELAGVTDRVGFVATAVGDHPDLALILERSRALGLHVALSSLRIPAMVPEVLEPLAASGARSVTIAPETGSDALRRALNKHVTNEQILAAAETAQRAGIPDLKMYFIVGLPGETDDDLRAIASLCRRVASIQVEAGRSRGRAGELHVGVNLLVPKPYTPYHAVPMLDQREARRRLRLLEAELRSVPNLRLDRPSWRLTLWQGYLSRAGTEAFEALLAVSRGEPLAAVLRRWRHTIEPVVFRPGEAGAPWHFVSSAPRRGHPGS